MKRAITSLFFLLLTISSFAQGTKKVTLTNDDYIMVWRDGGMVAHRLHPIYVLTAQQYAVDTVSVTPHEIKGLRLSPMPAQSYNKAMTILDSIPTEALKKDKGGWVGHWTDGVTTHVRAQIGGKNYSWIFYLPVDCSNEVRSFEARLWTCFNM